MLEKLRKWINKHIIYRNAYLTPTGECFRNYCLQISNNSLKSEISSYEDFLYSIRVKLARECKLFLDRKETAEFILMTYEEIL